MSDTFDLVTTTEEAWKSFRNNLADQIATMDAFDHILWELDVAERHEPECGPYIQVGGKGTMPVIAEVSSNMVLHPKFLLTKAERKVLRAAGWSKPDESHLNYWLEVDPAYADWVAEQLVTALREVFGVVHPAFLVDRHAEDIETFRDDDEPEEPITTHDVPLALEARDRDHLVELVDLALGSEWGRHTPTHDEDGDIPYVCGNSVVFVRVLTDIPVIRVFAELAVEVTDPEAAAFEVAVLNRDQPVAKFVLRDNVIQMSAELIVRPFVPDYLRAMVSSFCQIAPRLDGDLAHRVGGRRFLDSVEDEAC